MGLPGFDKGLLAQQRAQDSCMAPHMDTDPSMHHASCYTHSHSAGDTAGESMDTGSLMDSAGDMHSAGESMCTGSVTCIRQVSPCAPAPSWIRQVSP